MTVTFPGQAWGKRQAWEGEGGRAERSRGLTRLEARRLGDEQALGWSRSTVSEVCRTKAGLCPHSGG